ncbi:hypothetical protein D7Y15_26175 [Corallococcus sp. AB030]|uniref:hypothetical protein n=1 Tax=Corallococcus sp. AB030 TaxID=2316716 RepID=UPI000EBDE31C|nr:hypothetical protein [Corallococcus sp. AB030]RKI08299.1 hypothetical protein D7Y15_26175 [Corallococcus sp. AB030]
MSKHEDVGAKFARLASTLTEEAVRAEKPWTYVIDGFMKEIAPELARLASSPEGLALLELKTRHEVTQRLVARMRTRLAVAPDDAVPSRKRRLEAEVENLQRHEDYLAAMLRHTESLAETRRSRWVPRAALVIACASLVWNIIAALWHLK